MHRLLMDALDRQSSAAKTELWEHFESTEPNLTAMKNALAKLIGVTFTVYSQGCIEPWTKVEEAKVCKHFLSASDGLRELKKAKEREHKDATAGQSSVVTWAHNFCPSSGKWQDAVETHVAKLSDNVKKHLEVMRQCAQSNAVATEGHAQALSLNVSVSTA